MQLPYIPFGKSRFTKIRWHWMWAATGFVLASASVLDTAQGQMPHWPRPVAAQGAPQGIDRLGNHGYPRPVARTPQGGPGPMYVPQTGPMPTPAVPPAGATFPGTVVHPSAVVTDGAAHPGNFTPPGTVANPYVPQSGHAFVGNQPALPSPGHPHAILPILRQATSLEKQGNLGAALQAYQHALQRDPNNWQGLVSLARAQHRAGQLDAAIQTYEQVLAIYPGEPLALNDLGLCLARKGDLTAAMTMLGTAVKSAPNSKRYRNNLATVLIEANQVADAQAILQEIHGEAIGAFNLGYLLSQRGRHTEAAEYLRNAIALDPSLGPARQLLAQIAPSTPAPHSATTPQPQPTPAVRGSGPRLAQRGAARTDVVAGVPVSDDALKPRPSPGTLPGRSPRIQLQSGQLPAESAGQVLRADYRVTKPKSTRYDEKPPGPENYPIPGVDPYP